MKQKDYDVSKLPRWAAGKIRQLEGKVESLRQQLADERSGRPDSAVLVRESAPDREFGLDADSATVRFFLGDARYPDGERKHWVDARLEDGRLLLIGKSSLVVHGKSSNSMTVDVEDRYELAENAKTRDLGEKLMENLKAKGLWWQDGLNLIAKADPAETKKLRLWYKEE